MLYRILREKAKVYADKIAIVGERRSLTYRRLLDEVRKCAAFLSDLNLKPEDRLVVGIPPCPEFYVLFYAAAAIGVTVIPVLPSGIIPGQIRKIPSVAVVGDPNFLKVVRNNCTNLSRTIVWDRKGGLHVPQSSSLFKRKGLIRRERVLAVSSSGTTGDPSLSFRSAELLLRRAKLKSEIFGVTQSDVFLSSRPYNNGSSINAYVVLPIISGCTVVVREKFQRFQAAETISREGVTVLYGVPLIFEVLASIPRTYAVNFPSLRLCISAGAPLTRLVSDEFYARFGVPIHQVYGATHIHPAFNYDRLGVPGAVGQIPGPFPMAVVDKRNRQVRPDAIGELVLDFPKVKDPFWRSCLKNNPRLRGRYIHTGDLAKVDRERNLYVVGRKSPFIKVGANRVAPAEVENVLRSHPQVREAVVLAHRPGRSKEAVKAIVVPNGRVRPEVLLQFCARHLDGYKCPRKIEFLKELPRNSHGKIIRHLFNT